MQLTTSGRQQHDRMTFMISEWPGHIMWCTVFSVPYISPNTSVQNGSSLSCNKPIITNYRTADETIIQLLTIRPGYYRYLYLPRVSLTNILPWQSTKWWAINWIVMWLRFVWKSYSPVSLKLALFDILDVCLLKEPYGTGQALRR